MIINANDNNINAAFLKSSLITLIIINEIANPCSKFVFSR